MRHWLLFLSFSVVLLLSGCGYEKEISQATKVDFGTAPTGGGK